MNFCLAEILHTPSQESFNGTHKILAKKRFKLQSEMKNTKLNWGFSQNGSRDWKFMLHLVVMIIGGLACFNYPKWL